VRLYSGKVEAERTAITNHSAGRKVQILYGSVTVSTNPSADYRNPPDNQCLCKSKSFHSRQGYKDC